eukprot:4783217-Prymnesium_polylepis.1
MNAGCDMQVSTHEDVVEDVTRVRQLKLFRRYISSTGTSNTLPNARCWSSARGRLNPTTACAIVPLYPKELTPPRLRSAETSPPGCVGSVHSTPCSALSTCSLSTRSCAFGPVSACSSASVSSPVIPAAGSACPKIALTPPTTKGSFRASCASRTAF